MIPPPSEHQRWFDEEVQPHELALRAYLRRRFADAGDVDDLVQESFVRLLAARRRGPVRQVRAYLFAVARNAARSVLRRPRIFSGQPLTDGKVLAVAAEGCDVVRLVERQQEAAALREAIAGLPERCREVFVLVKLQGCSHQEAADRLGLSIQTVHTQVARGLAKCALHLRGLDERKR